MIERVLILSDEDLWKRFLAGDDKSITIVYERYINDLYAYGMKITNNESLVKDCVQDVFINLIDQRRNLLIGSHIHIYLFRSLRNKLLDEIRSSSRKHEILNSNNVFRENLINDSIERVIIQEEERSGIRKELNNILNGLTNKQREIIYLKYTECLSYDEISVLLDIDKASARTLLYRTLRIIKANLNKKGLVLFFISRLFSR